MKCWIVAAAAIVSAGGCTTTALERETLSQSISLTDLRLREAVANLAAIAHDPATLPSWSSIYAGTSDINDSAAATSATAPFVRTAAKPAGYVTKFGTETLDVPVSRAAKVTWTLDPSVAPEKLRALRCVCRWVLYGPEYSGSDFNVFLTKAPKFLIYPPHGTQPQRGDASTNALNGEPPIPWPDKFYPEVPGVVKQGDAGPPGFYFDVADQLGKLDSGWLHVGCKEKMPKCTSYWAESCGTCVWVTPEGVRDLTEFALIMQEIARVQLASTAFPPPITRKLQIVSQDNGITRTITAYVDMNGFLVTGDGAAALQLPVRRDNVSTDAALRSQIANSKSTQ